MERRSGAPNHSEGRLTDKHLNKQMYKGGTARGEHKVKKVGRFRQQEDAKSL